MSEGSQFKGGEMIRRVWREIRGGENIDLYITLLAAVVLTILSTFGIGLDSIAALTLAILALIAFSLLRSRHKLDAIARGLPLADPGPVEEFPPEFILDLTRGREIWLTGFHPHTTLVKYHSLLEEKLKNGDNLRVLVADPDGAVCEMAAMRFPGNAEADLVRTRVISTLSSLCELRRVAPGNLEIRTIDYLLEYGAFLIDPNTEHGVAYVRRYTFKAPAGIMRPKLVYRQQGGKWYNLICAEILAQWNSGTLWKCQ
jgi:hypothetical protein